MWELIHFNKKDKNLTKSSTFNTEEDCIEARINGEDIILYNGKLPNSPLEILKLESRIRELNNYNLSITSNPEEYPDNCWCKMRGSYGRPGDRCYYGTIECAYCNSNGYCWIVDTKEYCEECT